MRFIRETRLENMCLKVIVGNLERFYKHEEYLNKYNQFLRRRYSDKIFIELIKYCKLTEDFVNWLISPFWTDVIIGKTHTVAKFVPKLKQYGEAITLISFRNSSTRVEVLSAVVCCLPNLRSLNLCYTTCSDSLLLLIRKMCPHLNELNVSECDVTDVGMKNLCYFNQEEVGFESLKVLNIENTLVKYTGVEYLLNHLNLQALKYHDLPVVMYNIYQSNVNCFVNPIQTFNFTDLTFNVKRLSSHEYMTKVLKVWTVQCPHVERLAIIEEVEEQDLNLCCKFEKLKSIKFVGQSYEIQNSVTNFIQLKGASLSEIYLSHTGVSVEVIARFCRNLKKLTLDSVKYEDFDESQIQSKVHNLDNVTKLKIKHTYIGEHESYKSIYLLLQLCKNVDDLSFNFVRNFPEQFIDIIITMPHVNKAKFPFTDINQDFLLKLFSCQNINRLWCDGCPYIEINANSELSKLLVQVPYGNTLSWQIDFFDFLTDLKG